jgi:hypothetical protein
LLELRGFIDKITGNGGSNESEGEEKIREESTGKRRETDRNLAIDLPAKSSESKGTSREKREVETGES